MFFLVFPRALEYIDIEKDEYYKLSSAIKEIGLPFTSVEDFINSQIDRVLAEYDKGKELAEEDEDTY